MLHIDEAQVAVRDYTIDQLRLRDGRCFERIGRFESDRQAKNAGSSAKIGDSYYRKILLRDTTSEGLRYPEVWIRYSDDPEYKKWVEGVQATPFPLPYVLPQGFSEKDVSLPMPFSDWGNETQIEIARIGIMGRNKNLRVDGHNIGHGIELAQKAFQAAIDQHIDSNPGYSGVLWRIRPESDIQFCSDGKFLPKFYARLCLIKERQDG